MVNVGDRSPIPAFADEALSKFSLLETHPRPQLEDYAVALVCAGERVGAGGAHGLWQFLCKCGESIHTPAAWFDVDHHVGERWVQRTCTVDRFGSGGTATPGCLATTVGAA